MDTITDQMKRHKDPKRKHSAEETERDEQKEEGAGTQEDEEDIDNGVLIVDEEIVELFIPRALKGDR